MTEYLTEPLEDIPYDRQQMVALIINAGLNPMALSMTETRELCDVVIQARLDGGGIEDEQTLNSVERLITGLIGEPEKLPQRYDVRRIVAQQHDVVRKAGAHALSVEDEQARASERELVMYNSEPAKMLGEIIADLLLQDEIDSATAESLAVLFQLPQLTLPYDAGQRAMLSRETYRFITLMQEKFRHEPVIKKRQSRPEYRNLDIRTSMDILYVLNELLKLPASKSQPPLNIYMSNCANSHKSAGNDEYYKEDAYVKVRHVIGKAFGINLESTEQHDKA